MARGGAHHPGVGGAGTPGQTWRAGVKVRPPGTGGAGSLAPLGCVVSDRFGVERPASDSGPAVGVRQPEAPAGGNSESRVLLLTQVPSAASGLRDVTDTAGWNRVFLPVSSLDLNPISKSVDYF